MAQKTEHTVASKLHTKHIILPIMFGLAGVVWQFTSEFSSFNEVWLPDYITGYTTLFLLLAVLTVMIRDGAGMLRLWLLSEKKITFWGLFRVRMLYEFTSAITPSAAGGSTLEMLFINKEGVKFGESTAICIVSLFLDELFFVLSFPIMLMILPIQDLFNVNGTFMASILSLFLIGYIFKVVWVAILFVGIFIKPTALAWMIKQIFKIKFLRRWKFAAMRTAADIRVCSRRMRVKPFSFWLQTGGLSALLWIARFSIVNVLIMAFSTSGDVSFLSFYDNIIVVCRQIITMVVMMIAPTPGGSGFIEVLFESYLGEYVPAAGVVLLLITSMWRLLTYYNYLIIGAIIAPKWIARNFSKKNKIS